VDRYENTRIILFLCGTYYKEQGLSRRIKIEEEALVKLLTNRDSRGMEILYDNYSATLYGVIHRIVKTDEIAEDVLQEAFLKIWNNFMQYDPSRGNLFTWMLNICRNLAIDKVRSRDFVNQNKNRDIENTVSNNELNLSVSYNPDTIDIRKMVDSLDPEYRKIIDLLFFEGYSQSEASEKLNIPLGTVKTRSRAAIQKLKSLF
jgi:RNA polymerase sigma factor (sigma-70 family)